MINLIGAKNLRGFQNLGGLGTNGTHDRNFDHAGTGLLERSITFFWVIFALKRYQPSCKPRPASA